MKKRVKIDAIVYSGLTDDQFTEEEKKHYGDNDSDVCIYTQPRCYICKRKEGDKSIVLQPFIGFGVIQPMEFNLIEANLGEGRIADYWLCTECTLLMELLSGQSKHECTITPLNVE